MSDYLCTGSGRSGRDREDRQDCREDRQDCRSRCNCDDGLDGCRDNIFASCRNECVDDCCDRRDDDRDDRKDCRDDDRDDRRNDRDDDRDDRCDRRRDCCCRRGLVQALQILLRTGLSNLIDFQQFAFVTKKFLVGSPIVCVDPSTTAYDNLDDLEGTFNRFTPCACDFIDVSGVVYLPNIECPGTGLTASRLNLCDILAIAFTVLGDTEDVREENYRCARQLLRRLLQNRRDDSCPPFPDPCDERHCDCEEKHIPGGSTSLIVGDLLLANVTVLGQVGRVLVVANDADQRLYFVCTDKAVFVR